jgi:hypothetical protein
MVNPKTLFAYILSIVSLIISLGIASQGKLAEVEALLSPTPSATPLPKPEPFPGAARLARCQALSQPRFFFYRPALTPGVPQYLLISGTVYASDLSTLPNALVEIWLSDDTQVDQPIHSSIAIRTDKAGHYEFNMMKLTPSEQIYLHYRVKYRDYCPLLMNLHLVIEPQPRPVKQIFAQVEVTGPILQGPVDIVLPVPPSAP